MHTDNKTHPPSNESNRGLSKPEASGNRGHVLFHLMQTTEFWLSAGLKKHTVTVPKLIPQEVTQHLEQGAEVLWKDWTLSASPPYMQQPNVPGVGEGRWVQAIVVRADIGFNTFVGLELMSVTRAINYIHAKQSQVALTRRQQAST